jgi:3-methylcrotonyl-CoA carboxylase beta subunit
MSRIISKVDTESAAYRKNFADMSERVKTLRQRLNQARYDRPQRDIDRLKKSKKLTVRERLDLLLDPGTPFLELSALAANRAYGGDVHGAGQVSGIGIINGNCFLLFPLIYIIFKNQQCKCLVAVCDNPVWTTIFIFGL